MQEHIYLKVAIEKSIKLDKMMSVGEEPFFSLSSLIEYDLNHKEDESVC